MECQTRVHPGRGRRHAGAYEGRGGRGLSDRPWAYGWSRRGSGGRGRTALGASRCEGGHTALVIGQRKRRGGSPSSLASCHFGCRSTCYGRLRPLPAKRLDVRSRHADGPAGGGPAGPDVPMSICRCNRLGRAVNSSISSTASSGAASATTAAIGSASSHNHLVAYENDNLGAVPRNGDARAFELLVERHERKIF